MILGKSLSVALALGVVTAPAAAAPDEPTLLHPMFQQHAVLQRDAPIRVYGHADSAADVEVSLGGNSVRTRADETGRWEVSLPALPAGGPHVLRASSEGRTQQANDVLIGDVWLCAGQSNMVLQVHRALDSRAEIAGSANDRIRMLTVGETGSVHALEEFATDVEWKKAAPETVPDFSASCFYFARELQKTVDVPMGLIVAAWGGSRIQAWTSAAALRATGDYDGELAVLGRYAEEPVAAAAEWGRLWQNWWRELPGMARDDEPWSERSGAKDWRAAPRALGPWERWGIPELAAFDGMVWYRTRVTLSADQAAQDAVLSLGAADEIDIAWVNGRSVGSSYGWDAPRQYAIPRGVLKAGENLIAVNVLDTYRDGGLVGPPEAHKLVLGDGSAVALDGEWQYRVVPPDTPWPPRAPWHTAAGLSTLYNGMIAPIGRFGMRGIVWYQGESNTFEAAQYGAMLETLIADWRDRFSPRLPFLSVQLAGYGVPPTRPGESGWAQLREAQRRHAQQDDDYGFAVTIDIGDRYDVHPPNKQELGRRLARLARNVAFGEKTLPPSGPRPATVRHEKGAVVVGFGDVTGDLVAYGAEGPIGFELCGAEAGSCRWADARIRGHEVVLQSVDAGQARRVRYAWADHPIVTLFDGAGLPAGPFELPIPTASER